jgi:uncharacterized protein YbjT (DUF2867 family)
MPRGVRVAVAGATGRVGRHVVEVLNEQGQQVVAMSRATGVNVISGAGLDGALEGVEVIIDVATGPSAAQEAATEFFVTATGNLHQAGKRAGVGRMVVVSIIGCDKFSLGYSAAKAAHERAALAGPIPVQIVRAAQFHEFVPVFMAWGTQDGVCYVPKMRCQLVAARTVAEVLVKAALGPEGVAGWRAAFPEIAGPREESLVEAARLVAARRGQRLEIEGVNNPDDPDRLEETGGLLPSSHAELAGPTFAEWLQAAPAEVLNVVGS